MNKSKIITRTAISITIGIIFSMIKIFRLPFGGAVTFFSMLFISLPGYWFGLRVGIIGGIISGFMNFVFDPVLFHPFQFILDYVLGFGSLGFSGVFKKKSLLKGFLLATFLRFICNFISGIIFFESYAPKNFPLVTYSFLYNFSYISVEACMSIILLCLPIFKNIFELNLDSSQK